MSQSPIESFLDSMESELKGAVSENAIPEILAELRSHLEESVEEHRREGSTCPEEDAIAEFGQAQRVGKELVAGRNAAKYSMAEKTVLALAALAAFTPTVVDLGVDFSSWLTGSDFLTYALIVPVALWTLALLVASVRCRKLLSMPIAGIVLASGFIALALGGFSRASQPGPLGTQTRGTAYRRMNGLLGDNTDRIRVVQVRLEAGIKAFASGELSGFRDGGAFVLPQLDPTTAQMWSGDTRSSRYMFEAIQFSTTSNLAEAKRAWAEDAPKFVQYTEAGIAGYAKEAAELRQVVDSSWGETVRREFPVRGGATGLGLILLVGCNFVGTAIGYLIRRGGSRRGLA